MGGGGVIGWHSQGDTRLLGVLRQGGVAWGRVVGANLQGCKGWGVAGFIEGVSVTGVQGL